MYLHGTKLGDVFKTKLGATTGMISLISIFISGEIYRPDQAIIILYIKYMYTPLN